MVLNQGMLYQPLTITRHTCMYDILRLAHNLADPFKLAPANLQHKLTLAAILSCAAYLLHFVGGCIQARVLQLL